MRILYLTTAKVNRIGDFSVLHFYRWVLLNQLRCNKVNRVNFVRQLLYEVSEWPRFWNK